MLEVFHSVITSWKEKVSCWAGVVHAFNPSTQKEEAGGYLSLRPAWSTRASARTARTVRQRNPVPETNKQTKKSKTKQTTKKHHFSNFYTVIWCIDICICVMSLKQEWLFLFSKKITLVPGSCFLSISPCLVLIFNALFLWVYYQKLGQIQFYLSIMS